MVILGIESSCDETSAAVYSEGTLRSNIIASQRIHSKFGGVVPELASRAHQTHIHGVVAQALSESDISMEAVDAIAVAHGPGLMGALLVGLSFAKGLCIRYNKPLIGVNHIDAHMYASFIENKPQYPFLSLIVSGGHTRLVLVKSFMNHELLGDTRDDAAGEAFDKTGKLLGLPYPAGPEMDILARTGDSNFVRFPRSFLGDGFEFSFSGLKTAVLYHLNSIEARERESYLNTHRSDLCASISEAITEVLVSKLEAAMHETGVKHVVLAGGVSANSMLRSKVNRLAASMNCLVSIPKPVFCTDNGAMIAITGYLKARAGLYDDLTLTPFASFTGIAEG